MAKGPSAALLSAIKGDSSKRAPSEDKLKLIHDAVIEMRKLADDIAVHDEARSKMQARFLEYQQKKLPDLFAEAGIDNIGIVDDGNQPPYDAEIKPYYNAKIPENGEEKAYDWLRKNKHADLIKTQISMAFPMGSAAIVKKVLAALKKLRVNYTVVEGVHAGTLKAFVKEQIEETNISPPKDLFGISTGNVVVIKPRKESRAKRNKE